MDDHNDKLVYFFSSYYGFVWREDLVSANTVKVLAHSLVEDLKELKTFQDFIYHIIVNILISLALFFGIFLLSFKNFFLAYLFSKDLKHCERKFFLIAFNLRFLSDNFSTFLQI